MTKDQIKECDRWWKSRPHNIELFLKNEEGLILIENQYYQELIERLEDACDQVAELKHKW